MAPTNSNERIIKWLINLFAACRCIKGEPAIEEYYDLYAEAEKNSNQISEAVMQSSAIQQFLTPGRVVVVKSQSVSVYENIHINVIDVM